MRTVLCTRTHHPLAYCFAALFTLALVESTQAQERSTAQHDEPSLKDVIASGKTFVEALRPELREKATFEFGSEERLNWHFIPRDRQGLMLKEMNLEERRAAHDLLRTVLSSQGYLKANAVMSLEAILRELEGPGSEERRDPEKYYFSVFGSPSSEEPWGFRVEGHHLSLNFSSVDGLVVSSAPMFYGANPAEVLSGPQAGLRVLGDEEDLARELVKSLSDEQRKQAVIAETAPRDVITVPGHEVDLGDPQGLAGSEMTEEQGRLLRRLIALYARNLRPELRRQELGEYDGETFAKTHFAWAGGLERGEGHYYRIHAPRFLIEYDNTQNDANHIHAVWHSLTNDFALDTLRKHYEEHKHD